jgi:hypothetical protein
MQSEKETKRAHSSCWESLSGDKQEGWSGSVEGDELGKKVGAVV